MAEQRYPSWLIGFYAKQGGVHAESQLREDAPGDTERQLMVDSESWLSTESRIAVEPGGEKLNDATLGRPRCYQA